MLVFNLVAPHMPSNQIRRLTKKSLAEMATVESIAVSEARKGIVSVSGRAS
jgi:hypothetical protein